MPCPLLAGDDGHLAGLADKLLLAVVVWHNGDRVIQLHGSPGPVFFLLLVSGSVIKKSSSTFATITTSTSPKVRMTDRYQDTDGSQHQGYKGHTQYGCLQENGNLKIFSK